MSEKPARRAPGGLAAWKWGLLPLMAAVILMAYLWAKELAAFQHPASARIIFWHVPMAILSMGWFAAAAFYSGRYLLKQRELDDLRAAKASEMGLVLTVLATLTGAIFSKMQWAGGFNSPWWQGYWQWDPKQTAIVIVILIFAGYFALRASVEDRRTRAQVAAVYAILGFVSVPFLYYVIPQATEYLGVTSHPENVLTTREGMDAAYRTTYWLATLGFLGITVWVHQLQLRLEAVRERRALRAEAAPEARIEPVRKPVLERQG